MCDAIAEKYCEFEEHDIGNTARTTGHGTGLGLAVTKRVIGLHGGNITVETAVPGYTIAPPTKPCLQMLDIKKNFQRQKNLKCVSISAFSFLDNFPLCLRLFGNV
ncbi:MAG: sensor histidine kinase [Ruminococcus sp.]|nr:sensor histidine kinase [Ruminococcus sp.]